VHAKLANYLFILLFFYSLNVSALESRIISNENVIFSSETLNHLSGAVTRNEWRSSKDGGVIQLEIKNAKSGQILIEKTKIIYQQKMGWRIEDINENVKLKINPKSINSQKPIKLSIKNQIWAITLTNEKIPIPIEGIATETEPRVDIFMKLIN
jgi:hypothetical protein